MNSAYEAILKKYYLMLEEKSSSLRKEDLNKLVTKLKKMCLAYSIYDDRQ